MQSLQHRIFKFLASVKLAVIVILAIGTITAVGTFVESAYNSSVARKLVYHSPYMYAAMILLIINLTAVMIDRWPWKKRHTGFVLAHIGIITLLVGAFITQKYGIDGTMRFEVGQTNNYVTTMKTDLAVYATFDGDHFSRDPVFAEPVDFYMHPPTAQKPVVISLPDTTVRLVDYIPFALEQSHMAESTDPSDGPAVRFQLQNDRVNVTDWVAATKQRGPQVFNLGPAQIVLTLTDYHPSGHNEIVLRPAGKDRLRYIIYNKDKTRRLAGITQAGAKINTGWMGLVFRVLDYLPRAREEDKFVSVDRPTGETTSAVKVAMGGKEYWLGLNSMLKLFTNNVAYVLLYENSRIDLGFGLQLKDFEVGHYQGTTRASSYASKVLVPGRGLVTISMNEPLKYRGYTFYQASFDQDEKGLPHASILSVNWDPGRAIKYLGCILIVSGTLIMFYFKRKGAKTKSKKDGVLAAS